MSWIAGRDTGEALFTRRGMSTSLSAAQSVRSQREEPRMPLAASGRWGILACAALIAAIGWSTWASFSVGGAPLPFTGLAAICVGAGLLGRVLSTVRPWLTPALLVLASLVVGVLSGTSLLGSDPLAAPLGYGNANAAFFVQAAAAALMLVVTAPGSLPRILPSDWLLQSLVRSRPPQCSFCRWRDWPALWILGRRSAS
jgi:hypothetical protein